MSAPLNGPYQARPALRSDVPAIVDLSLRTFMDSEPTHMIAPGAAQYPDEYRLFLLNRYYNRLRKPASKTIVVEDDTHQVIGYACWNAEGDTDIGVAWTQERTQQATVWSLIEPFYLRLEHYYQRYISLHCIDWAGLEGLGTASRRVFGHMPERRLHLDVLMVDPSHQGKGIGKALVLWGLQIAKEAEMPVRLTATRAGRTLYEKTGFEVVGQLVVPGHEDVAMPGMVWTPMMTGP